MSWYEKTEEAVKYLAESEEDWSSLKASVQSGKKHLEITLASLKMKGTGKSDAANETQAKASETYLNAVNMYHEVLKSFYLIDAKRFRAEQTIEIWRSVNSARGRGNPL